MIADFLDVRFNLNDQTSEPYRKPSNEPVYINKQLNHPPNIIADNPKAIYLRRGYTVKYFFQTIS